MYRKTTSVQNNIQKTQKNQDFESKDRLSK